MRSFLLLLLSVLPVAVKAQATDRSPVTFVYKLHHDEAVWIFDPAHDYMAFDSTWLHTLADTFHGPKLSRTLPSGAYLFVSARQEKMVVEPRLVTSLFLQNVKIRRGLSFILTDSLGREIQDAAAFFNSKPVPYDPDLKAYNLSNAKHGGYLHIRRGDDMLFYKIDEKSNRYTWNGRWSAWSQTGLGKVVSAPVRWVDGWLEGLKDKDDGWRRENRKDKRKTPQGYIAFSKTQFQQSGRTAIQGRWFFGQPQTGNREIRCRKRGLVSF